MNQSKFSLADLITVLTALFFSVVCFFGVYFYKLGDVKQSVIYALVIFILLFGTAFGAKFFKQTSGNFLTCFKIEMILLILFSAFMFLSSYNTFPHYFVVSEKKSHIKEIITSSITQAENMFKKYETYAEGREKIYKRKLQSIASNKGSNPSNYDKFFANNGVSDEVQIETKMFTVHAELFPTNYEEEKANADAWLADSKLKLNNWWSWNYGIVNDVNDIDSISNKWLKNLVELSTIRLEGEETDNFKYELKFDDVKTDFKTKGSPTILSIIFSILAYLLILFSWFNANRDFRSPGSKELFRQIFTRSSTEINDL